MWTKNIEGATETFLRFRADHNKGWRRVIARTVGAKSRGYYHDLRTLAAPVRGAFKIEPGDLTTLNV